MKRQSVEFADIVLIQFRFQFQELDGNVSRGFRGKAEVIGKSMAGVGGRWLGGVGVCRRGSGVVGPITDSEPTKEGFEEEDTYKRGEYVTLYGALVVMSMCGDGP
jgi:hypothetical protein